MVCLITLLSSLVLIIGWAIQKKGSTQLQPNSTPKLYPPHIPNASVFEERKRDPLESKHSNNTREEPRQHAPNASVEERPSQEEHSNTTKQQALHMPNNASLEESDKGPSEDKNDTTKQQLQRHGPQNASVEERPKSPSDILRQGTQGVFVPIHPNDTDAQRKPYQFRHTQPLQDLIGALNRYTKGDPALENDSSLLGSLRNKSLLLLGDSTDYNLVASICYCPREEKSMPETGGVHSSARTCSGDASRATRNCHFAPPLNLTLSVHGAEYALHPYGEMPYKRVGPGGPCEGRVPLRECLLGKFEACSNGVDSLREMHHGLVPQPDMVVINMNLWFWFRMQWYGRNDEKDYNHMSPGNISRAYQQNFTILLQAAQDYLPNVTTWVARTSLLPKPKARIQPHRVALINRAIQEYTERNPHVAFLDWQAMITSSNISKEELFQDDLHGKHFFNLGVGNVYLNALAAAT